MGHALFGLIWFKNAKVSVHAKIWYLDYFKYIKFDCEVQFFYLDILLQILLKKFIWYFDAT